MKHDLSCVLCGTKDFDLVGINHPVTKKPLGIIYCCQACKPELVATIKSWAKVAAHGLDCYEREWEIEAETYAP